MVAILRHRSLAVAVPNAPSISPAEGLHPRDDPVPPDVITGGVLSSIQRAVLATVDVLPHPSLAVNVLTWSREQPVLITAPSLCVTVVAPHPSLAVAVPNAPSISAAEGLQPRNGPPVPPGVSTGGVRSSIQLTVREAVEVLLQPSIANHDLV